MQDVLWVVQGHSVIRVVGQPGHQQDGFAITSPVDGTTLRIPPNLDEGRYVLRSGGGFPSPTGGRGDLILDYSWPGPIAGADREVTLNYRTPRRGKGIAFTPVPGGPTFPVKAPRDGARLTLSGYGGPGEFGGPRGDMHVTLQEEQTFAARVSAASRAALAAISAGLAALVNLVMTLIGGLVVLAMVVAVSAAAYYIWTVVTQP